MATINVTLVNGVTKSTITEDSGLTTNKIGGSIINESNDVITFRFTDGTVGAYRFGDFVDNLGATNSGELVDALLSGGYFENALLAGATTTLQNVNVKLNSNDLASDNPLPTKLTAGGEDVDVYNPVHVNLNALSANEVDYSNSSFIGWTGTQDEHLDLFKSPFSGTIQNTNAGNKIIEVGFYQTQGVLAVGLGANAGVGFKNVKIEGVGSDGTIRSLVPAQTNGYTGSFNFEFFAEIFNKLRVTFETDDPITLSNISIRKFNYVASQIRGRTGTGGFQEVAVTESGRLKTDIPTDIFGNLPVADQFSIHDNSRVFQESIDLFWSDLLIGAGASNVYDKATSKSTLSVTTSGEIAATQLKHRHKYQPLKAHKSAVTGLFTQEVGVEKYIGLFDLDSYSDPIIDGSIKNGTVTKITEDNIYLQTYNEGVLVNDIQQADWNIDRLDGAGNSGVTLDLSYAQIIACELEWLGVGSIRFIMNINGTNIPVHQVDNANFKVTDVWSRTANLPICYMIKSVGGAGSMKVICNAIVSGGGHNPIGVPRKIENTTGVSIAGGAHEAILFVRLKPDSYEGTVDIKGFRGLVETSGDSVFRVLFNPTWGGSPITWVDKPNSHLQYAIAAGDNNILDEGVDLGIDYASSDSDASGAVLDSSLKLGKSIQANVNQEGRYDIICLSAESLGGTEVYYAALQYVDIF